MKQGGRTNMSLQIKEDLDVDSKSGLGSQILSAWKKLECFILVLVSKVLKKKKKGVGETNETMER